jgi:AcrR family transcriptional regulator
MRMGKKYDILWCMSTNFPHERSAITQPVPDEFAEVRRRPGGRSARVQAAVFEATIDLLEEKGYEALSFAAIAARAGINKTSLYRRWETKDQLIVDAVSSQVVKDFPIPDTGTLRSDLIELVRALRAFLQSSGGQALVQIATVFRGTSVASSLCHDYWRHRYPYLRPLFDRAIARGELSPGVDLQLLFEALLGILYARAFLLGEPLDETLPERIVDLIMPGLGGER